MEKGSGATQNMKSSATGGHRCISQPLPHAQCLGNGVLGVKMGFVGPISWRVQRKCILGHLHFVQLHFKILFMGVESGGMPGSRT